MGTMTIDGRKVEFTDEKNVLTVIRNAGIDIPTLCYHSELSTFGACRLCTVEDDRGKTFASCSEVPRDGMVIHTNTNKLRNYRKLIVELLLAAHCRDCTTCIKSGECHLQDLAHRLGVHDVRFENTKEPHPIDDSSPAIVRDPNKCILCGDCVRMCDNVQGVNAIDFAYRGTEAIVSPAFNKPIAQTDCVNCGQCRVVCPTGAISIKTNIDVVWDALADKDTIVIAQIAPAVRVAAGEEFGIPKGENVMGKLVGVLHRLGFDEVYDTAYGADLTVMEESKEFMERFNAGENLPLFTSCCPAWVKFCENRYPEFVPHLSSCRSPQQMFGAVTKSYYAEKLGVEPERIFCVSLMPCLAKKDECTWDNGKDVDAVLTTREVERMLKSFFIKVQELEEEEFDDPLGVGSGAGVIFGATGGVMEAALRSAYYLVNKTNPEPDAFQCVRGLDGWKEAKFTINGNILKVAVASSLSNARKLMEAIATGKAHYDFVEVMACPGGCINGGGQPIKDDDNKVANRSKVLYGLDKVNNLRFSHENPSVMQCYKDYFGEPLSHKAHELLHISH